MVVTWIFSIGLLIFVVFFFLAYCMQTAMSDLYESLMDDLENSPLRDKIERYKSIFDEKVLGRTAKPAIKKRSTVGDGNQVSNAPKKKLLKSKVKKKLAPRRPKTKEDLEEELQRQLEEDVLAMMDEESKKRDK